MAQSEFQAEIQRLSEALQANLADLASLLGGYAQPAPSPAGAAAGAKKFVKPSSLASLAAAQQAISRAVEVKERPFDAHSFFVATQEITYKGNTTPLGQTADYVIVSPSIDAQIEFDTSIQSSTPAVAAGTQFKNPARTMAINHKGVSTSASGQLTVWAWRWTS